MKRETVSQPKNNSGQSNNDPGQPNNDPGQPTNDSMGQGEKRKLSCAQTLKEDRALQTRDMGP